MLQKRKLGLTEHYSKICHDYANGATILVGMLQIEGALDEERLCQALKGVQNIYPALRAVFDTDNDHERAFFVIENPPLPFEIIFRNSENSWMAVVEEKINTPFAESAPCLWRFTWLTSNECHPLIQEFIVCFHHSISDGISMANFFNALLNRVYPDPIQPLLIEKQDVFLPSVESMLRKGGGWWCFFVRNMLSIFSFITLKKLNTYEKDAPIELRRTKIEYREIEKDMLNNLLQRCRDEGVTLTALLTASLVLAVHGSSMDPKQKRKSKQFMTTPVNMRRHCSPEIHPQTLGCFVNFYRTIQNIDHRTQVWEVARAYKSQLVAAMRKQGNLPPRTYSPRLLAKMIHTMDSGLVKRLFPFGIGVTNIGRIPFQQQYGCYQVKKIYFGTNRNLGDWLILLHAATVDEKLFLGFCYATPLLSPKRSEMIVAQVIELLTIHAKCNEDINQPIR